MKDDLSPIETSSEDKDPAKPIAGGAWLQGPFQLGFLVALIGIGTVILYFFTHAL
jgi:hypothetical protein